MKPTKLAKLTPAEQSKIVDFLRLHPLGVLALVDTKGDPHASAVYFSVDSKLNVSFTTKRDTAKYEILSHHNKVMVVVHEAESQSSVQITGKAVEVTDPKQQQEIYYGTLHAAQQTGEDVVPPVAKISAGPFVGFTIEVDEVWLLEYGTGNNFANAMKHAKDDAPSGDPA